MVQKYPLKGIHTVKAKGHTYWYAWRGGPRLHGQPGSPEFHASYNEAIAERYMPEPGKFRSLVMLYKTSSGYQELAASTKTHWGPWLNRIADDFGMLSIVKFNKPEMVRPLIRQWRNRWADKPRAADMGMQVLSRVLSYAVELGKIAGNPCEGIKGLYSSDRSDIIWTDTDIARIKAVGSPELRHAIDLAAATGLRRGALLRLSWSHVRDDENCIIPGMGNRNKRTGIIPLYDDLRALLARSRSDQRRSWPTASAARGLATASARWSPRQRRKPVSARSCTSTIFAARPRPVLYRRSAGARHRRDPRLDREERRKHHSQIRWP